VKVDEAHASGEAGNRPSDLLLGARVGGLGAAALLQRQDIAFKGAVEAARRRRLDRGTESVSYRRVYLF
jgi:hypothetical protein